MESSLSEPHWAFAVQISCDRVLCASKYQHGAGEKGAEASQEEARWGGWVGERRVGSVGTGMGKNWQATVGGEEKSGRLLM